MKEEYRNILLGKMMRFCDYRERCTVEIEQKLNEIDPEKKHHTYILNALLEGEYFSDQLYADSFASGKFRIKSWGKSKIKGHLYAKQIDPEIIANALTKIDDEAYKKKIRDLVERKLNQKKLSFQTQQKVLRSLFQKGFESESVLAVLEEFKEA